MKNGKKICVIGGGRWGENHIRTLCSNGNLAGIVDTSHLRLLELSFKYPGVKTYENIEEAVKDEFDGFIAATPAATHYKIGSYILGKGFSLLLEKPMALNSNDSEKLVRLAREKNAKLMVGHVLLFHPAVVKIKQLIEEGRLGKLCYILSNRLNMGTVRTEENVLWSFAPHDIAVFNYLTASRPSSIYAAGGCFLQEGIHDLVSADLVYPGNVNAHLLVSWLYPVKEHKLVAVGNKGSVIYEQTGDGKLYFFGKGVDIAGGKPVICDKGCEEITFEKAAPLEKELEYFINHLSSGFQVADGENGHECVCVLEAIERCIIVKEEEEVRDIDCRPLLYT